MKTTSAQHNLLGYGLTLTLQDYELPETVLIEIDHEEHATVDPRDTDAVWEIAHQIYDAITFAMPPAVELDGVVDQIAAAILAFGDDEK